MHPFWKGLLVNNQPGDQKYPVILDIESKSPELNDFASNNAVQSMMLFDTRGLIRINKSDRKARRCVVATCVDSHLYIILTSGEVTLWDLARELQQHPVRFVQAMAMDGGIQAQLSIRTDSFSMDMPSLQIALPAAISFFRSSNN